MKNVVFVFLFAGAIALTGCNNSSNSSKESTSVSEVEAGGEANLGTGEVVFANEVYDFGEVKEGEVVEHVFKFTNTGEEPVIINRVSASCGCTTPEYTSTPVAPGKEGEIKVRFDSNGQLGSQQKIITVVSNAKNNIQTIQLKGVVN